MGKTIKTINNVSEYIEELEKLEKKEGSKYYYRGHSNKVYTIGPSIYRNEGIVENEHNIYNEALKKNSHNFLECRYHIDYLRMMQHYNIPTRLIDICTNPLVALFFGIHGSAEKAEDGEVIVLEVEKKKIKSNDSDTIEILASLARFSSEFKNSLLNLTQNYNKLLEIINNKNYSKFKEYENLKTEVFSCERLTKLIDKIEEISKVDKGFCKGATIKLRDMYIKERGLFDVKEYIVQSFNENFMVRQLTHEVGKYMYNFDPVIDPRDLLGTYFVDTLQDNVRIKSQTGAFMISAFKDKWNEINRANISFNIPKGKKDSLKKELSMLGIDESTVYPELQNVGDMLKNKYGEKNND